MFKITIILILISPIVNCDLFYKDSLDSKSELIKYTESTKPNAMYKIKVYGEYSQWSLSEPKGKGNDAVWFFDLPKYGNIIVDNFVKNLITKPLWFGDTTIYNIPIVNQKFSMIDYVGFRVNDRPLPMSDIDTVHHEYFLELKGNGSPISFQIWDYVQNTNTNSREARYEDNEGKLFVEVEEILDYKPDNCGILSFQSGNLTQIILRAELDLTKSVEVFINGIKANNIMIECGDTLGVINTSTILIDNSGSMNNPLDFTSNQSKYEITKQELEKFKYDSLINKDFLYLNETKEASGNTELLRKIYDIIDLIPFNGNLIVFTDGYSEKDKQYIDSIKKKLQVRTNIKLYLQLYLTDDFRKDKRKIDFYKNFISYFKDGKLFTASNREELFENIKKLSKIVLKDNCCYISFILPECDEDLNIEVVNDINNFYYTYTCSNVNFTSYAIPILINSMEDLKIDFSKYDIYSVYGELLQKGYFEKGIYLLVSKVDGSYFIIYLNNL